MYERTYFGVYVQECDWKKNLYEAVDISSKPLAHQMRPLGRLETHLHISHDFLVCFNPCLLCAYLRLYSFLLNLPRSKVSCAASSRIPEFRNRFLPYDRGPGG